MCWSGSIRPTPGLRWRRPRRIWTGNAPRQGLVANDGSLAAQIAAREADEQRAAAQLAAAEADFARAKIDLSRREAPSRPVRFPARS